MNTPLVSIAMCTYNGIQFLKEQLDSVINQTYYALEIIIVDDDSTDGTVELIQEYAVKDSRIQFQKNNNNLGLSKNFEKAISLCNGGLIALCDQDDIWMPNKIAVMVELMDDSLLIYHNSQFIDEGGNYLVKVSDLLNMYQGTNPLAVIFYNSVSGHACMFKQKLVYYLQLYGSFDTAFYHDWWIAYIALCYGRIKYINEALVNYRQHSKSSTDLRNVKGKSLRKPQPKYYEIKLSWLKKCYDVKGDHTPYIGKLINYLENKTWLNSFIFFYLLISNCRHTCFIKKKPVLSKLNYLRKASFRIRSC